jgi:aspartate aminotransferase
MATCDRLEAAGAIVAPPQGAFYIFPDFSPLKDKLSARGIKTSTEMCERILEETGVAILPGSAFGRPDHELTTRIALVDFDGAKTLSCAKSYPLSEPLPVEFVDNCCFKVSEAIDKLCDWMKG